mgnify:CR=1 FL=1
MADTAHKKFVQKFYLERAKDYDIGNSELALFYTLITAIKE